MRARVHPALLVGALAALCLAGCPKKKTSTGSGSGSSAAAAGAKLTRARAERKARAFLAALAGSRFAEAYEAQAPPMAKVMPRKKLAATWGKVALGMGSFKRVESVEAKAIEGSYSFKLRSRFERGPLDVIISIDPKGLVQGLFFRKATVKARRPQHPRPPFPYAAREVSFVNKTDKTKHGGTLTLPEGKGPFAAAVLITGSGSQDRDETIMGHKPFLVIADHLTRAGFAVLRVDDRGVGKSGGDPTKATIQIHATDVSAAMDYLNTVAEIDKKRVGLIGHSEGGIIAPIVATQRKDVAFIISLAGTGLPGTKVIPAQSVAIAGAQPGATPAKLAKVRALQEAVIKAAVAGDVAKLEAVLRRATLEANKLGLSKAKPTGKQLESTIVIQLKQLTAPWTQSFFKTDPVTYWAKVRCPVLVLNGTLDTQVDPKLNLPPVRAALAKNKDATLVALPGLNHLFQHAKTGQLDEYAKISETFDKATLARMAAWLKKRFGGK